MHWGRLGLVWKIELAQEFIYLADSCQ